MTSLSIIENKISQIKKYQKIIKKLSKFSKKEITNNDFTRGTVERYLFLICQAAIDLASIIVSYKRERKPLDQKDSFFILEEEKIISKNMALTMAKLVGFRNILTHEYAEINYDIVFDVLINKVKDIEKFVSMVEKKILK
jgi:uncharacterized protein YutE (UPF0331/DUF86 family)